MVRNGFLACGVLLATMVGVTSGSSASPYDRRPHAPSVFHRDNASAIGQARQRYDRAQYESYQGNPGAQFELRQKRQNLCRNVPEMC